MKHLFDLKNFIGSGVEIVEAICCEWNSTSPDLKKADHFGVFLEHSGSWQSCGEDRATRTCAEISTLKGLCLIDNVLIEFRYSSHRSDRCDSYDLSGRLIEAHSGPKNLFQLWSFLSLAEAIPALCLNFDKTK